jgi:hypothetical protein
MYSSDAASGNEDKEDDEEDDDEDDEDDKDVESCTNQKDLSMMLWLTNER